MAATVVRLANRVRYFIAPLSETELRAADELAKSSLWTREELDMSDRRSDRVLAGSVSSPGRAPRVRDCHRLRAPAAARAAAAPPPCSCLPAPWRRTRPGRSG